MIGRPGVLFVDTSEPKEMVSLLEALGVPLEVRRIAPGDYVIGEVGVERKSLHDFFGSMIKGRLFEQLGRLREVYPLSLLLVEGDLREVDEYRNPAAFWGAYLSVLLGFQMPILFTSEMEQSAMALHTLYQRQAKSPSEYGLRHRPKMMNLSERQRFLVQGLPGVGEILSRNLLEYFGTARKVFTAPAAELVRVAKIGTLKAAEIARVLDSPYEGPQAKITSVPGERDGGDS